MLFKFSYEFYEASLLIGVTKPCSSICYNPPLVPPVCNHYSLLLSVGEDKENQRPDSPKTPLPAGNAASPKPYRPSVVKTSREVKGMEMHEKVSLPYFCLCVCI